MRRRLSILLVMSLVLISIMLACFMGCTKAPDAFKDVDLKDADAVMNKIADIISGDNYTIVESLSHGDINLGYSCKYKIAYQFSKKALSCKSQYEENSYVARYIIPNGDGTISYENLSTINGWMGYEQDISFEDECKANKEQIFADSYSRYDLSYNEDKKIIDGTITFVKEDKTIKTDATIEFTKDSIIITMKCQKQGIDYILTSTISNIGTTNVDVPTEEYQ